MESDPPPSYREAVHQDGPDRAAPTPAEDSKPVVSADVVPRKPALNPATIVDSATIAAKKSRRAILLGVAAVVLGLAGFASAVAVGLTVATGVLGTTGTAPRNATLVVLTTYSGCVDLLTSLRASPGYNPSAYMQVVTFTLLEVTFTLGSGGLSHRAPESYTLKVPKRQSP